MRTMCSREIFTKKCRQQQNFDSDPKGAWHYNHVTFTPIAKHFMLYCRLIYLLFMLYVRLTIKVKVGIPQSFKVRWYPHKITGSSHLKEAAQPSVVSASDSQSGFPGFESRSGHLVDLLSVVTEFKSSATLVNSQLIGSCQLELIKSCVMLYLNYLFLSF